jgi:hypothetical protein
MKRIYPRRRINWNPNLSYCNPIHGIGWHKTISRYCALNMYILADGEKKNNNGVNGHWRVTIRNRF